LDAADVRGLLGLLLADGSLVRYRSPSGGYVQLTLTAGAKESAFLEEKVAEFRQFLPTEAQIVPYKTTPRANGRSTLVLRFRVSTTKLRLIYNLLYPGGERRITSTALEMLGARAAAWLWAEGARVCRDGSVELTRVGGDEHEATLVQQWLATLTGAHSEVLAERVRPRLHFSHAEARKIRIALLDYAPLSRRYLFTEESWDVSTIRSARTELQLGEGLASPQGSAETPLA
jgi:hypothetical protein